MSYKYNPYRDTFEYIKDENPISATIKIDPDPVRIYQTTWIADECIEKMADAVAKRIQPERSGVFECFHCGERSVVWQSDFSFEDYDLEGDGIVQVCRCANCGAEITYMIREDEDG